MQSYFTRHLFEGIANGLADCGQTGTITLSDLFSHIKQGLKRDAPGQTPQPFYYGLNPSVVVAKNPLWRPAALPPDLVVRTTSPEKHVRGIAVEELLAIASNRGTEAALALAALRRMLKDDSMLIRTLAQQALVELEEPALPPKLREPDAEIKRPRTAAKRPGVAKMPSAKAPVSAARFGDDERIESRNQVRRGNDTSPRSSHPNVLRDWMAKNTLLVVLVALGLVATGAWFFAPTPTLISNSASASPVEIIPSGGSDVKSNLSSVAGPAAQPSDTETNDASALVTPSPRTNPAPSPTPTPKVTSAPVKKEAAPLRAEIEQDTALSSKSVGSQIAGPFMVFFEWSKSSVTPEAGSILDGLMQQISGQDVALIALSSSYGSDEENGPALARKRGAAIKGYLTARGVAASVIKVKVAGLSKSRAGASGDGVRNVQGRRVDIAVFGL